MSFVTTRELTCDDTGCSSTFTARPTETEMACQARASSQGWTQPRGQGDRCPKHSRTQPRVSTGSRGGYESASTPFELPELPDLHAVITRGDQVAARHDLETAHEPDAIDSMLQGSQGDAYEDLRKKFWRKAHQAAVHRTAYTYLKEQIGGTRVAEERIAQALSGALDPEASAVRVAYWELVGKLSKGDAGAANSPLRGGPIIVGEAGPEYGDPRGGSGEPATPTDQPEG
jgi:hypothetical protein